MSNVSDEISPGVHVENFFIDAVRIVKLIDWLDWAIGKKTTNGKWTIVLPMIQRGSVWKPHQVIDLWDTVLRGMPFGGLMASHIPVSATGRKISFFQPVDRKLVTLEAPGGLSLIDGQQRTLAMLLAWPGIDKQMSRRLWVDFGDDDKYDHLLRLHVTTDTHPFGFKIGGPSGEAIAKLTLAERRYAAATYADRLALIKEELGNQYQASNFLHDDEVAPWKSELALDLRKLIEKFRLDEQAFDAYVIDEIAMIRNNLMKRITLIREKSGPQFSKYDDSLSKAIINHLEKRLDTISKITSDTLNHRIETLKLGLRRMFHHHFPIIEVPTEMLDALSEDDSKDPPLAVLFKRIGTGGTDLKTADYVFSVIKHLNPNCHSLVEQQLSHPRIAAIFTPTTIVMTAVRFTAAKLGFDDHAVLDKRQFTRLMRGNHKLKNGDTDELTFLKEFNKQIAVDGEFVKFLNEVLNELSYVAGGENGMEDVGLPKHALALIEISALEVILFWLQKNLGHTKVTLHENRHKIVRFLLCWHLAVLESSKASVLCFRELSNPKYVANNNFPEELLFNKMVDQKLALPLRSPSELQEIAGLTHSSVDVKGLRGWRRFSISTDGCADNERDRLIQAVELYKRWWSLRGNYSHTLLLWLQRDYVFHKFESMPAQPGLDDETPFDFDHICPESHWNNWTGRTGGNRLISFHDPDGGTDGGGHWRLGNAIGNVRVWDSSDNRSDSDASPNIKLKFQSLAEQNEMPLPSCSTNELRDIFQDSAISVGVGLSMDERPAWIACSPISDDPKHWDIDRALAFQKAIELRTFNLYLQFYTTLRIGEIT